MLIFNVGYSTLLRDTGNKLKRSEVFLKKTNLYSTSGLKERVEFLPKTPPAPLSSMLKILPEIRRIKPNTDEYYLKTLDNFIKPI